MSDLEKYGLVALTIIVVLILFIAMNNLNKSPDPAMRGIVFEDPAPGPEGTDREGAVVVVLEPDSAAADFDFLEPPRPYPGREARETGREVPGGTQFHDVRGGESLSSISQRYYGNSQQWKNIAEANPGIDPGRLQVGQRISIPMLKSSMPVEGGSTKKNKAEEKIAARHHRVLKGDTLQKISKLYYGSMADWEKIFNANRNILPEPRKLQVGMDLLIP